MKIASVFHNRKQDSVTENFFGIKVKIPKAVPFYAVFEQAELGMSRFFFIQFQHSAWLRFDIFLYPLSPRPYYAGGVPL